MVMQPIPGNALRRSSGVIRIAAHAFLRSVSGDVNWPFRFLILGLFIPSSLLRFSFIPVVKPERLKTLANNNIGVAFHERYVPLVIANAATVNAHGERRCVFIHQNN